MPSPAVTVMIAVPSLIPVTLPLASTVATDSLLDEKVGRPASEGITLATISYVSLISIVFEAGLT